MPQRQTTMRAFAKTLQATTRPCKRLDPVFATVIDPSHEIRSLSVVARINNWYDGSNRKGEG
jgi:hypothetical protein